MANGFAFGSTHWSVVARAAAPGSADARAAIEELCRAYWWPLYAYLRRIGRSHDDASDLVQGLFSELIEKGRFAQADPDRGRFRSWLLSALKFQISHEHERERALKRGGRARAIPLDRLDAERRWQELSTPDLDAELLFDRAWALAVLERALAAVGEAYARAGKAELFAALRPALVGEAAPEELRTVAARLGMSVGAVKSASFRLRKALGESIRAELAATVDDARDVEDELNVLFAVLAAPPSRSPNP